MVRSLFFNLLRTEPAFSEAFRAENVTDFRPGRKSMENDSKHEARKKLIDDICNMEWEMFDKVQNKGGRASCQNDEAFFKKMRECQFGDWNDEMLLSYCSDLMNAKQAGRNLPMEKYAFMMEHTCPAEFAELKDSLPTIDEEKAALIREIVAAQVEWEREVDQQYPYVRAGGRPLTSDKDTPMTTSFETYLTGELKTYSTNTLLLYVEYVHKLKEAGVNLALLAAERTVRVYGYASLDDAEQKTRMKVERMAR